MSTPSLTLRPAYPAYRSRNRRLAVAPASVSTRGRDGPHATHPGGLSAVAGRISTSRYPWRAKATMGTRRVEPRGLEPLTPCLPSPEETQPLPIAPRPREEPSVEPRGLEPLTPCLQSRCATNCAKAPGGGSGLVDGVGGLLP